MKHLNKQAFTVLELLVVLVLMAMIGATAFARVEQAAQNTRNKEREGDLRTLQMAIEAYQAKNGSYPKTSNLEDISWVSANLKGIDNSLLTDPQGATINKQGGYGYNATKDGTADCKANEVACGKYVLTAVLEDKPQLDLKSFN